MTITSTDIQRRKNFVKMFTSDTHTFIDFGIRRAGIEVNIMVYNKYIRFIEKDIDNVIIELSKKLRGEHTVFVNVCTSCDMAFPSDFTVRRMLCIVKEYKKFIEGHSLDNKSLYKKYKEKMLCVK